MKRVVAIVIIMAMVTTLFAFSVYAAPVMGSSYTASISSDDTNITAYAFAVYEEGVYQTSTGGSNLTLPSLLISVRIVNNTDKWVIKDTDQFKIRINGNTAVGSPFECIDIDNCQITEIATSSGKVDFTIKGDNSFVLAPNETYTLSFRFVNSAGFTSSPSIQFFNNQFLNSAYTIDELLTLPADELAYLSSLNLNLSVLIDTVNYSGPSFSPVSGSIDDSVSDITGYNNLTLRAHRIIMAPYYLTEDIELNSSNDTIVEAGTIIYPVYISLYYRNNDSMNYKLRYFYRLQNALPTINGSVSFEIKNFSSNFADYNYETGRNIDILPFNSDSSYSYLDGKSTGYASFVVYIYVQPGTTPSWSTFSLQIGSAVPTLVDDTVGSSKNVFGLLQELVRSLIKDSSDDNTEEAEDMNDDIHDAEQVWYDNNTEALEQVGLSNYRFSQSQSNGITQAVTQFQAVWNALGQWTNVYIFILILSISTYIIRHEPTTRVKQYRSSVQAERAERISYYGKKNAESRAASSGSTFKAALRRRK